MDFNARIMRIAFGLRHDFKKAISQLFRENDILFNEEAFFQNTSIDFEQLVQEAFCYGANMAPPETASLMSKTIPCNDADLLTPLYENVLS